MEETFYKKIITIYKLLNIHSLKKIYKGKSFEMIFQDFHKLNTTSERMKEFY